MEAMVGCSADCPARKWEADLVRMTRMEMFGQVEKAEIISGSFMVATLPDEAMTGSEQLFELSKEVSYLGADAFSCPSGRLSRPRLVKWLMSPAQTCF